MTDLDQRIIQRQAITGNPSARVRLLRTRIRTGDLDENRVCLAAYLGDESSRAVIHPTCAVHGGFHGKATCKCEKSFPDWTSLFARCIKTDQKVKCDCNDQKGWRWRLDPIGYPSPCPRCNQSGFVYETAEHWIMAKAAVAAAWVVLPRWESNYRHGTSMGRSVPAKAPREPRQALKAAEAWLLCPCEEHKQAWAGAIREVAHLLWMPWLDCDLLLNIMAASNEIDEFTIRNAIREALVPWLLA